MEIKRIIACQVIRDASDGLFRYYWRFKLDPETYSLNLIHYALCSRRTRQYKFVAISEWLADGVSDSNLMEKNSRRIPLKEVVWDDDVSREAIRAMHARIKIATKPAEIPDHHKERLKI